MKVTLLGAHNLETRGTKHTCFLIDDVVAVDAGSLVTSLEPHQLERLEAILLTHHHFDHVRDIPTLGLLRQESSEAIDVYAPAETFEALRTHLVNNAIYPDFSRALDWLEPRYRFFPSQEGRWRSALGYRLYSVPMPHPVPAVGYLVQDVGGDCVGFTGDTVGKLDSLFKQEPTPRVLFVDLTFPDRLIASARSAGHLTPGLLREELASLDSKALATTTIMPIHRSARYDSEIKAEIEALRAETGFPIFVPEEGMVF